MTLGWLCDPNVFGGDEIFVDGYLNVCFSTVFIVGGVNALGWLAAAIYYMVYVRKYLNYEGKQKTTWTTATVFTVKTLAWLQTSLARFLDFSPLQASVMFWDAIPTHMILCCIWSAFSWLATRGAYKYPAGSYPTVLTISDLAGMFVWLSLMCVLYAEWNRNLPHGIVLRFFFIGSTAANVVNLSSLTGLAANVCIRVGKQLTDQNLDSVKYYGSEKTPVAIVTVQAVVALLMFLGIFPSLRNILEPSDFQEKHEMEEKQGGAFLLLKVMTALGNRMGFFWVLAGYFVAATKGYIQQEVNFYDGRLFDHVRTDDEDGTIESLKWLIMLYGTLSIGSGLTAFLCSFGAEKLVHGQNGIRARLFHSLLRQEMNFHNTNTSAELASRFSSDTMRIKVLLAETLPEFAENLAMVFFGSIFLLQTAWDLTLYMLGVVPLAFGLSYFQSEKLAVMVAEGQDQNSKMTAKVQDVFGKYHTVLVYGKQDYETFRYKEKVKDAYAIFWKKAIFNGIMLAITGSVSWGTQTLAFFLGVDLFRDQDSFAVFITFTLYALNVVQGLLKILTLLPSLSEAIGSAGVVLSILQRKPLSPEEPGGSHLNVTQGSIAFEDVRFTYPNADATKGEALKGISFKVQPNSKVAIVGDSGAGKSTILQLICRFYDPTHGRVLIDGQDISKCSNKSIRASMAMVSQDSDLFSMTLLENILYGLDDPENTENQDLVDAILYKLKEGRELRGEHAVIINNVMNAITLANANDFIKSTSDLTFELGTGGSGLSGGQKQRVTIARALYKNPKVLVLDEVTSALDQVSESIIQAALDRLIKDRTVIVVAHRLHTIKNSDLILVMDGGTISAQGTHDELMISCSKYKKMVEAAEKKDNKTKNTKTAQVLRLFKDLARDIGKMDDMGHLAGLYDLLLPLIGDIDSDSRPPSRRTSTSAWTTTTSPPLGSTTAMPKRITGEDKRRLTTDRQMPLRNFAYAGSSSSSSSSSAEYLAMGAPTVGSNATGGQSMPDEPSLANHAQTRPQAPTLSSKQINKLKSVFAQKSRNSAPSV